MYQKGDFVTYGCKGVCEIKDITTLKMDGIPKDRLYYELQMVRDAGSRIFTPVEHETEKNRMRLLLTEEEACDLLECLGEMDEIWISDDREREAGYRASLSQSDAKAMLAMIRSLYLRRKERMRLGRKLTAMDSKYLRMAEENLYTELSLALHMSAEEVEEQVTSRLDCFSDAVKGL